jgi:hypothetical protein
LFVGVAIDVSSLAAVRQTQDGSLTGCLQAGDREGEFVLVVNEEWSPSRASREEGESGASLC